MHHPSTASITITLHPDTKFPVRIPPPTVHPQILPRSTHMHHTPPLLQHRHALDSNTGNQQRPLNAHSAVGHTLRPARADQQGDASGEVGAAHAGAVHEPAAAEGPVGYVCDGAARGD